LKARYDNADTESRPNAVEYFVESLNTPRDEIQISVDNLEILSVRPGTSRVIRIG
jgi:hypothetical protein